jgi:ornithine cyclodeaminase
MSSVYTRAQLEAVIRPRDVIRVVEEGFVAYSRGEVTVPPVGELLFPDGDCHIKYGYRKGDSSFAIKIATGFPGNAMRGVATSNGAILVFSTRTGELLTIFQDEGLLTDARTAAAGAVAAKHLAPSRVERIGILGAGTQGKLQLEYLKEVFPTRRVMVWSRSRERAESYRVEGFEIESADSPAAVAKQCRLIVTTTCSRQWLLGASDIQIGTHITAVGADGGGKQELEPELFRAASVRAVDSRVQCMAFGDSSYALRERLIAEKDLVELGEIIDGKRAGRENDSQITIADLTGVAIQDIQIAKLALASLGEAA